ncbi:MAG: phosphatase PAP2 family protein [Alistipes sp.]|nr:phosphatase PAP2 family protein [Alistipes sp.]
MRHIAHIIFESIGSRLIVLLLIMSVALPAVGRTKSSRRDTTRVKENWWQKHSDEMTRFRAEQLVVPASLVTIGAMGIGPKSPMYGMNCAIHNGLNEASKGVKIHFDDYVQYVPVAFYLTLDYMGVKAKHSFAERVAVAAVTYIAVTAISQGLKYAVREPRPDTGVRNSFPSGHTMTAFAGAELVRTEYGWHVGLGAYALASTVGFMRLYNGRHWFNDVLAGAGLGILSARIGYWMLPLNRHIFRIPRKGQAVIASPMYNSYSKAVGVTCAMQF